MGYSYRNNGQITDYWPDNNENTLYIEDLGLETIGTILDRAREHFGEGVDLRDLNIQASQIHTSCLTYDQYDPSDYTNFIVIGRTFLGACDEK